MKSEHHGRGFTLIEMMITVAIVAILAAIAYPSYTEQVARSRRGDAQAALQATAQWIERQYTLTNAYDKFYKAGVLTTLTTAELVLQKPLNARTAVAYTLSFGDKTGGLTTPTANGFSLRMVPQGPMAGDRCGTFTLTNTGAKDVSGAAGVANCWDR